MAEVQSHKATLCRVLESPLVEAGKTGGLGLLEVARAAVALEKADQEEVEQPD